MLAHAQLFVFGFGSEAEYEGRLVGALERIEAGGALRIVEVMFVRRELAGEELVALDFKGRAGGGLTAPLLNFRLDPAARRRATEKAMAGTSGMPPEVLDELAAALEPGAALAAVLVEHAWARALDDAIAHTQGTVLAAHPVEASALAELGPQLLAAAKSSPPL